LIITLYALFGKITSLSPQFRLPIASIDPKIEFNETADALKLLLIINVFYNLFFKGYPSKISLFQGLLMITIII